MPVPSWSPIPDSDIDPDSPLTSSLLTRLRDQWAAFFGVDPTAATPPPFDFPPSQFVVDSMAFEVISRIGGSTGTTTGIEFQVCDLAKALENHDCGDSLVSTSLFGAVTTWRMEGFSVTYSAGAPTSLDFRFLLISGALTYLDSGLMCASSGVVQLPLDDTYNALLHTSLFSGVDFVRAKARLSSGIVYLQFQVKSSGAHGGQVNVDITTKSFQSRG